MPGTRSVDVVVPGQYGRTQTQKFSKSPEDLQPDDLVEVTKPRPGGYGYESEYVEVRNLRDGDRVSGSYRPSGGYSQPRSTEYEFRSNYFGSSFGES